MTKQEVKEVLDRVLKWPAKRQKDAVSILTSMEQEDAGSYHLTDAQVAEVRRRLAKKNVKYIPIERAFERFNKRGHENNLQS
jgi:uncharacterized protein (UPF0248 family)